MGQTEKMAALVGSALLGLIGVAAAFYAGDKPDWAPVAELLWELLSAGAAGALSFPIMEQIKNLAPQMSKLAQSYVHVFIATILGPLAWFGLIALDLTEVSPRGAMMVAAVAFGTGKQIWAHYKDKQAKMAMEAGYRAGEPPVGKPFIMGDDPGVRIRIDRGPTDLSNSGDAIPLFPDEERGPSGGM